MGSLGRFALGLALLLSLFGLVVAVVGARTLRAGWVETARRASFAVLLAVVCANATMLAALLRDDFSVAYVASNSSVATPTFFKVLSLWAADDGSLLLWNLVLAGYLSAVALLFRRHRPVTFPYALAVLFAVQAFYLALVNGPVRPFAQLVNVPADGRGPAPLLQNHPLMAVHPPFLYLGFIGFTVPFAFGLAHLLVGDSSDRWAAVTRRWTLVVWCFLTVGLLLGALWSYSVLGWGGYWAWDPVENVALLPWLVATAFLHSSMLAERRGIGRLWNVALVIGAFALTTFGTFLTRGNVLSSVHAFAQSGVGPMYLGFLGLVLVGGYGLLVWRLPLLRTGGRVESLLSREAAMVGNNVLLLSLTGIVLMGTVFPLLVEATTGRQVTVGGPYFREATAPVALALLLLVGTAPMLPWRRADPARLLVRLRIPMMGAAIASLAAVTAGVHRVLVVLGIGLAALVAGTNAQEILVGVLARGRRGSLGRLRRGRRRYAGLAVHIGLAVLAVGITTSSTLARQTEVTLKTGQSTTFAGYHLRFDGVTADTQPQRTVLTARVSVTGADRTTLRPRLNLYPAASEPIGSPSIRRGLGHDLYASLLGLQDDGASATFRFFRNPGVAWIWLGGALMGLAGVVAAWPARRPRRSLPVQPEHLTDRDLVVIR